MIASFIAWSALLAACFVVAKLIFTIWHGADAAVLFLIALLAIAALSGAD